MSDSNVERRAHPRIQTRFDLQGGPGTGETTARMVANNLSLGGLCCTSTDDFPEMTRLAVRLMLPLNGETRSEPVEIEAVVVRRRELNGSSSGDPRFELSLFFTEVDDDVRSRLDAYIQHR